MSRPLGAPRSVAASGPLGVAAPAVMRSTAGKSPSTHGSQASNQWFSIANMTKLLGCNPSQYSKHIYIYTKYIYICMFVAYDGLLMLPQGTSTTKGYSRMITLLPEAMEKSGFLRGGKKPKGGAEWGWYLCVKHDEIMWKYVCVKLCKRLWNQMKRKQEVHAIVHVFCETWDVFRHLAPRKPMIGGFWCCWSLKSWTMRYGRVFRKPTGQARRGPQIKKKKTIPWGEHLSLTGLRLRHLIFIAAAFPIQDFLKNPAQETSNSFPILVVGKHPPFELSKSPSYPL